MKVKVEGILDKSKSLVENVLGNADLTFEKVDLLRNANKDNLIDDRLLDCVDEATDKVLSNINRKIAVISDCDCDGVMSTAIVYKYLKHINPNVDLQVVFHKDKSHGLDGVAIGDDIDFLWIPDAGTNDTEKLKQIVLRGTEVLVTDHHLPEKCFEYIDGVTFVNSQLSKDYSNKHICGCGVTWKVLRKIDEKLGINYSDQLLDYVGVASIGDSMANELETRYFINYCCNKDNITSPFIKRLYEEKILKANKPLDGKAVAWNIVPYINSVCRYGSIQDKENMFLATVSNDIEFIDTTIKMMVSVKGKQDRGRKNGTQKIVEYIEANELHRYPVMVIDATKLYKDTTITGLLANNISELYNRPVIIVGGKEEAMKGSARNNNEIMCENFRNWCTDTGLFEFCAGHNSAWGTMIKRENIQQVMDKSLEYFDIPDLETKQYIADFEIDYKDLKKKDIIDVGNLKDLWVTDLKEPRFLIKNVYVNSSKIEKLGSRGNVLRINAGDISLIKTFLSNDFYNNITKKDEVKFGSVDLKIDLICTMQVNKWEGKEYPQLDIIVAESEVNTRAKTTLEDLF